MPVRLLAFQEGASVGVLSVKVSSTQLLPLISLSGSSFLISRFNLFDADASRDDQPGNPQRSQTNDWLPERFAVLILDPQQSAAPGVRLDVQLDKEGR